MSKRMNGNKIESEYMEEARWKRLLQEDFEKEAQKIIERVEADEELKDIEVPPRMYEELMEKIDAYERKQERKALKLMGKSKKKVYLLVAAATLVAVGIGITSSGGPQHLLEKKKQEVGGREMTQLDTKDGDNIESGVRSEQEFYEEVEEKLGFTPVRFKYLPENSYFERGEVFEDMQIASCQYKYENKILTYKVKANYVDSSCTLDIQESIIDEYEITVGEGVVKIKEYLIKESREKKYSAEFLNQNNYYVITGVMEKKKFEKILKNLRF